MKKFYFSMLCAALCATAEAQQLAVATFEDLNATADQTWDGSDESAMFVSGGYAFINNYVDWGGYGSWDGFGWSSMTSNSYASLADQFNSCVGSGVDASLTFGVGYYSAYMGTEPTVIAADASPFEATGCYVTNAAYAYTSMLNGDDYSKKFDATDWFLLTATGYLEGEAVGTADFYLAHEGQIVSEWEYFDLSALGTVDEIHFTLSSSDVGQWGMNTPAYFCIDNFGATDNTVRIEGIRHNQEPRQAYDIYGRRQRMAKGLMVVDGQKCILR